MKLLVISNNPNRPSYRQRLGIYIDLLQQKGIDVELAKFPSGMIDRYKLFHRAAKFDTVFLHKKRLNFFDAFWLRKFARKVIYDFDDAIMYNDKQPEIKSTKRLRDFARTASLADSIITGNTYLADHAKKYNNNVHILPTGLDTNMYDVNCQKKDDEKIRLVWIGSKSTLMYLEVIRDAIEEIGRRFDNVILRIICDEFIDLENMPVEKINWMLETQCRDLCESDIGLAPLTEDNFTRGKCGFKILQYMAAGLPVIASPVGVNKEYVFADRTGFTAKDKTEWVDTLSRLITDANMRNTMGSAARTDVQKFDLKVIGQQLADIVSASAG